MRKYILMASLFGLACFGMSAVEVSKNGEYVLTDFGETTNAKSAKETMDGACKWIIGNGGGILVIPPAVTASVKIENTYQGDRESGATVTIRDLRMGYETCYLKRQAQVSQLS